MNKLLLFIISLCCSTQTFADSGQAYMFRFQHYMQWSQHLPTGPDPDFIAFIDNPSPLSEKLRHRWLYQLAQRKEWATYNTYYHPSDDIGLQCYAHLARYELGEREGVFQSAKSLWLTGESLPKGCSDLFAILLKNHVLTDSLIDQRIRLALEKQNMSLVTYLLKQYTPPRLDEIPRLNNIQQHPLLISQLTPSPLHSEFYVYGLKQLVSRHKMDKALALWQSARAKHLLTHAQQQHFLAHLTLYKALNNHPDEPDWFAKIDPAFYNETLLNWQIRYALKMRQWHHVAYLIKQSPDKDNPCWQYWLARSLEAQGQRDTAKERYQTLSTARNYYGFLASQRLKKSFSFENEQTIQNQALLKPYRPFTDHIKTLYLSKQTGEASRLLNDFITELPKEDKSALAYWVSHELQWHGKSVNLSNTSELTNQLSLRFPLAYQHSVKMYANNYQIPQELIYAIIRQESAFRDDATSSAGAEGLMQIMPATARVISKREHISYVDKKQLFTSQKNINIGAAYLQELAKRFRRHPILMVAAYNAGPKQVAYWLKNHPPKDIDLWIETLPWVETRNYLKNVIAFYAVYQYRMQENPDLSPFMQRFRIDN